MRKFGAVGRGEDMSRQKALVTHRTQGYTRLICHKKLGTIIDDFMIFTRDHYVFAATRNCMQY